MRPEIKACRECKYFNQYSDYSVTWRCSHPEIIEPDVIEGGYVQVQAIPARYEGKCGIAAKYWVAKESS